MKALSLWFQDNELDINISETKYVLINNKDTELANNLSLSINGNILEQVNEFQYLGITIDDSLNWSSQIENLKKKLNKSVYLFLNVKHEVSLPYLMTLYYANFYSHIKYGIIFWGHSNDVLVNQSLLKIQKKCLRTIFNKSDSDTCRPIFKDSEILTIVNLYILERCNFIFNNPLLYKRNEQVHEHNTRNRSQIHISGKSNKIVHQDSLIYNHLPTQIKNLPTVENFKKELKAILLTNPFYTIQEYYNFVF